MFAYMFAHEAHPSGSDPDAGARTRLSFTRSSCLWHLAMGQTLEEAWFCTAAPLILAFEMGARNPSTI